MKKILLFSILTAITSCENYIEINSNENPFILNSSSTFKGYFYKGSDSYYDYFESKWYFELNKKFKLKKESFKINQRFQKISNKELKIDLFRTPNIFGIIKQDTLYISKNL